MSRAPGRHDGRQSPPRRFARRAVWIAGAGLLATGFAAGWLASASTRPAPVAAPEPAPSWPQSPFGPVTADARAPRASHGDDVTCGRDLAASGPAGRDGPAAGPPRPGPFATAMPRTAPAPATPKPAGADADSAPPGESPTPPEPVAVAVAVAGVPVGDPAETLEPELRDSSHADTPAGTTGEDPGLSPHERAAGLP